MYAALVLLAITLIVNIFGAFILQRASRTQRSNHHGIPRTSIKKPSVRRSPLPA